MSKEPLNPTEIKARDEAIAWASYAKTDTLVEEYNSGLSTAGLSLENVTEAEILMAENPKFASAIGVDTLLVANGLYVPRDHESPTPDASFSRPVKRPPFKGNEVFPTVDSAAGYVVAKGSVGQVKQIINGAGVVATFNFKGSEVIAVKRPLYEGKIAAIQAKGGSYFDAKKRRFTV